MTAATRVSDLPDDCLACVLSFLPPALIARSAFVCSAWRAAAASPVAWMRVLPALCQHACFTALPLASRHPHPRAWCRALCGGVLLDGGVFHAHMDPNTAKLTVSVSIAKACAITWMDDPRYWHMETRSAAGAVFPEVPHLLTVCWLEATAHVALPFPLRCGVYDVAWRVARDPTHDEYARAAGEQPRRVGLRIAGGDENEEDDEESEGEDEEDDDVHLERGGGGVHGGEHPPGGDGTPHETNALQARDGSGDVAGGDGVARNPFHHMVGLMRRLVGRTQEVQARRTGTRSQHSSEQQQHWERRREAWRRVEKRCWFKWVRQPATAHMEQRARGGECWGRGRRAEAAANLCHHLHAA